VPKSTVVGGSLSSYSSGPVQGSAAVSSKPASYSKPSTAGSYQTSGSYMSSNSQYGADMYQASYGQYGSDSYYSSSATTTASYSDGSYASYQSYSGYGDAAVGTNTSANKASSYTQQPVGRGSYAVAGADSSYSTYSQAGGYQSAGGAAATYGMYDESGYYMESDVGASYTQPGQSYAGYDTSDPSYSLYDYSGAYDNSSGLGYGSVISSTSGSYMPVTGGPASYSSHTSTPSVRGSVSTTGKTGLLRKPSSTDEYYTASGKADPYAGYEGGDYWSNQEQSYYYSETGGTYGGYGDAAGGYDEYDNSHAVSGGDEVYPSDQNYDAAASYYDSWTETASWSAMPSGRGVGGVGSTGRASDASWSAVPSGRGIGGVGSTGRASYPSANSAALLNPLTSGLPGFCSTSVSYGTVSCQGTTGSTSRGGRQTAAGGADFPPSSYGISSCQAAPLAGMSQAASSFSATTHMGSARGGIMSQVSSSVTATTHMGSARGGIMSQVSSSVTATTHMGSARGGIMSQVSSSITATTHMGSRGTNVAVTSASQKSTSVGLTGSQRASRVDGFTSYVASASGLAGGTQSSRQAADATRYSQSRSESERRLSRWSDDPPGTLDSQSRSDSERPSSRWSDDPAGTLDSQSRSDSERRPPRWSDDKGGTSGMQRNTPHSAGNTQVGLGSSTQPADSSAPRVFDYGHQDCNEEQAARASDRSYYLADVNTARPAARTSSPSPEFRKPGSSATRSSPSHDYRRPGSSAGSDWQKSSDDSYLMSSRREGERVQSHSVTAGRSRDDYKSSTDAFDRRKSTSYFDRSSSSGTDRHNTSYGQASSVQDRLPHDRRYATESSGSSRSSSFGQRKEAPSKTSARTVSGLMDSVSLSTVSSAKTGPVRVVAHPSFYHVMLWLP